MAKLTSLTDRILAAFGVLAVHQAICANRICHIFLHNFNFDQNFTNPTSIVVNLVVTLLFQLDVTAGAVPARLTEALPGHTVGGHRAGAVA